MANPEDIFATITLELETHRIPADVLRNTVDAFVRSLAALTDQVCAAGEDIAWEIAIDKGSVLLAADPGASSSVNAAQRVRDMVAANPDALRNNFRHVARAGLEGARLWIGKECQAVAHIREEKPELHQSQIAEYGTVEGTLDTLSARGQLHFTISEPVWNIAVRCTVLNDELVREMQGMWRQRISARGMVRYDREGHPTSIQAEEVRPFPYDETPIEAYRGLYVTD